MTDPKECGVELTSSMLCATVSICTCPSCGLSSSVTRNTRFVAALGALNDVSKPIGADCFVGVPFTQDPITSAENIPHRYAFRPRPKGASEVIGILLSRLSVRQPTLHAKLSSSVPETNSINRRTLGALICATGWYMYMWSLTSLIFPPAADLSTFPLGQLYAPG